MRKAVYYKECDCQDGCDECTCSKCGERLLSGEGDSICFNCLSKYNIEE